MPKKFEVDALRADLAAIEGLLSQRSEEVDPVGWMQFTSRRLALQDELARVEGEAATSASVAVFFGGRPVIGSRGINAEFGAKALENFQSLVSTHAASLEGPLGRRGPVPQRDRTQLMITDVVRGSIGFALEEFADNAELVETSLKRAVESVCDFVYRFGSADEAAFATATEEVDDRLLLLLRSFFRLLDDAGATMRIIEDGRDMLLNRDNIERARQRTDLLELEEQEQQFVGTLYVLPEAKRFEIHPSDGSESIRGAIAPDCLRQIVQDGGIEMRPELLGGIHVLNVRVKEARIQNREPRKSYTLLSVRERPAVDLSQIS